MEPEENIWIVLDDDGQVVGYTLVEVDDVRPDPA
jgi:uncharacterized protein YuzE